MSQSYADQKKLKYLTYANTELRKQQLKVEILHDLEEF